MSSIVTDAVWGDIAAFYGFSEPVSSLTHFLAALVAIAIGPRLLAAASGCRVHRSSVFLFVVTVVVLFACSGVFHLLEPGSGPRAVARRLDHAAIWLLIAGTTTPIHVLAFGGWRRWGMLGVTWAAALAGIVLKALYLTELPEGAWLALYLGVGWVSLVSVVRLGRRHGWSNVRLFAWGGAIYSVGAILELVREPTVLPHVVGPHEVFHLAVIGGAASHWRCIAGLVRTWSRSLEVPAVAARESTTLVEA